MKYTTLSRAREAIRSAYGECNTDILTEVVNAIRQEFYSWYEDTPLFLDVEECFQVQQFCFDCNREQDGYRGVTLPRDYASVEAMWFDNMPVELHDRWRVWQDGFAPANDCGLTKDDVGDNFPTERDVFPRNPAKIRVVALNSADIGRKFTLRGTAITKAPFVQEFTLSDVPQTTDIPLIGINKPGGVVKEVTQGRVVLSEDNGRVLSIYSPDEIVPAYKRIRINGLPSGCRYVNIRAARQFVMLYDDNDVVETGNLRAWEMMARYLRINRKSDRSRDDIASEKSYRSEARALLMGDKSRSLGKSTQAQLNIKSPNFGRHALGRTRR